MTTRRTSGARHARGGTPRRRRTIQYLLVFVGCVLLVDALFGERGLVDTLKAGQQHQELERALAAVRAENARLREQARQLREDPAAIEAIAREEHGMIRPGEKLFILKDLDEERSR